MFTQQVRQRRSWSVWIFTLTTAIGIVSVYVGAAGQAPLKAWDTFSADLTIRQQWVKPSGKTPRAAPALTYRVERTRARGGWRTRMTLREGVKPQVAVLTGLKTLENPFEVTRMEFDGDDSPVRMYNRRGQLVPGPTDNDRRRFALPASARDPRWPLSNGSGRPTPSARLRDWAEDVVLAPMGRADRRRAFESQFGRAQGRVRGLDRYVVTDQNLVRELLVSPQDDVVVEVNTVERGELRARAQMSYLTYPGVGLVRRQVRFEQVLGDSSEERSMTDLEIANVAFTVGGRP